MDHRKRRSARRDARAPDTRSDASPADPCTSAGAHDIERAHAVVGRAYELDVKRFVLRLALGVAAGEFTTAREIGDAIDEETARSPYAEPTRMAGLLQSPDILTDPVLHGELATLALLLLRHDVRCRLVNALEHSRPEPALLIGALARPVC